MRRTLLCLADADAARAADICTREMSKITILLIAAVLCPLHHAIDRGMRLSAVGSLIADCGCMVPARAVPCCLLNQWQEVAVDQDMPTS